MLRGTLKALLLACAVSVLACPPAISQDWPRRPVKIIVIASPGGFPDIAARTVANQLTGALGQPVVVENRAGGGGNIATDAVAKAAPDGHTLLLTGNNHAVNPTLLPNPGFDSEKDLAPITRVAEANMVLVGSSALQANNITELIALSKRTPKAMSIATSAIGTPNHLGAELLIAMTKIDFVVVPYKGIGPAIPDLVSGQVQVSIAALTAMLPLIKSGKLKALAVTRPKRSEFAPEIPTAAESGLPGFDVNVGVHHGHRWDPATRDPAAQQRDPQDHGQSGDQGSLQQAGHRALDHHARGTLLLHQGGSRQVGGRAQERENALTRAGESVTRTFTTFISKPRNPRLNAGDSHTGSGIITSKIGRPELFDCLLSRGN